MASRRIKFTQQMGTLAVIEGTAKSMGEDLEFELSMTESISGPVDGVIKRKVSLAEIEAMKVKRRLFRRSKVEFTASNISTFKSLPGSRGFKYTVLAEGAHKEVVSFVREVLFDVTQVEMDQLSKRLG